MGKPKLKTDIIRPEAPIKIGAPRVVTPAVQDEICKRIASGRTLSDVSRDKDIPSPTAIYDEAHRSPAFAAAITRARFESAHGLAASVVEIADELLRGDHRDKPGWWAQAVRNACEQRRWLAAKYNAAYSDKVALTDADGGSIAQRLIEMTDAQRLEWATEMAERARRLLKKPMIDVTPGGRGNEMTPMRPDAQSMG